MKVADHGRDLVSREKKSAGQVIASDVWIICKTANGICTGDWVGGIICHTLSDATKFFASREAGQPGLEHKKHFFRVEMATNRMWRVKLMQGPRVTWRP